MKKQYFWACMLMAPAALVSCSDINLADLNTEVAFQVRELAIPVNLDKVKLSTMLDVDDDSNIKTVNGEYAIVVEGSFESSSIHIDPIIIKSSEIEGITANMGKTRPNVSKMSRAKRHIDSGAEVVATYLLSQLKQVIVANADKIHEAIRELSKITVETSFNYDISIADASFFNKVKQIHLEDFSVKIPRGIIGDITLTTDCGSFVPDYSPETGIISFSGYDITSTNGNLHLSGHINGVDQNLLSEAFRPVALSNGRNPDPREVREFSIDEEIGVESGEVVVYDKDFKNQNQTVDEMYDELDDALAFESDAELEDIVVKNVSGSFHYDVDDMSLEDVDLNAVPEILNESGTNIRLDNPQIYLYLHNGVVDGTGKAVGASTDLSITAADDKGHSCDYGNASIDANDVDNYIYLSPNPVDDNQKYEGFENAKHVKYGELSDVLSSIDNEENGLPTRLLVNTSNTSVDAENVEDLPLGVDYAINGNYALVAPLALSENSRIKYTKTLDGWASSVEGVVINKLSLTANATTDVPFELRLRLYPINSFGERMGATTDFVLPANAHNAPVNIAIEGDIRDLNGVKIDATAVAKEVRTLTPDMNIIFEDVKVTVSGMYKTEL